MRKAAVAQSHYSPEALRARVGQLLAELNPEQKRAATTINGPLMVLAGAGTGKTKVITARIACMIAQGISPECVVAVSFTNKAAREMGERLAGIVGKKEASKATLSTFHSFALQLLRTHPREAGLQKKFTIADEGESKALLRETLKEQNLEELMSLQIAGEKMSELKDKLFLEADFEKSSHIFNKTLLKNLFLAYNRRLRLFNMVDFDDIVYLATLLLRDNTAVRTKIQDTYKYLLVDEYQDTSTGQFEFVRLMAGAAQNICVVGDDDQSIYSWRGARPEVLFDFLKIFPTAEKVTLEQNYRCSPNILAAANAVIAENKTRLGKTLWSKQANVFPIRIHAAENERDEALFVADRIEEAVRERNFTHDHIAILVRSNSQTPHLEQVFVERKIPYVINGGSKFFDRKEVRDLFSYLKFANNPCDLNSLLRVVNLPTRGIGIAALEKIKERFLKNVEHNPSATAEQALADLAPHHAGIGEFYTLWSQARLQFENINSRQGILDALRYCFEHVGLRKDITQTSPSMQVANLRTELVARVMGVIEKLELPHENVSAVVDALHLDQTSFESTKDSSGHVQIMTIHASKGLEFPMVFLVGLEDNILPHQRSVDAPHGEEEERRLFYVALTRAKQKLIISHCGFRKKGAQRRTGANSGTENEPQPSRFLAAIPTHLVELSETDPATEEAKRMDAAKKLFEMFR